jgi:ribonuclease HI
VAEARFPDETADALVAAETALARRDPAWPGGLEALLDGAFAEVGASGRAWSRDDVVAILAADPPNRIELRDLVVERVAEDVALVRFVTEEPAPPRRRARRVSVWVRHDGTWRVRYHQGTLSADVEASA